MHEHDRINQILTGPAGSVGRAAPRLVDPRPRTDPARLGLFCFRAREISVGKQRACVRA